MGSDVIGFISDPVGSLTDLTSYLWDYIESAGGFVWSKALNPVIEPIMEMLGISDETGVLTQVLSSKVLSNKTYNNTLTKIILEKQRGKYDSTLESLLGLTSYGYAQFNQYYNKGLTDFVDYLPETNVTGVVIDNVKIKPILDSKEGTSVTILNSYYRTPESKDWVYWYLQETYAYRIDTNYLFYSSKYWKLSSYFYNYSTNNYTCNLKIESATKTITKDITTVTITNISLTEDNKNTLVVRNVSVYDTYDSLIDSDDTILSNTNISIPKDSEVNSTTEVIISEVVTEFVEESTSIVIPSFNGNKHFVVYYGYSDVLRIWLYDPTTNVYPDISAPSGGITNFDMMPIVTLRNNTVSINNGTQPDRYNSSKKILKSIGLDVDILIDGIEQNPDINKINDSFILFGVSPSNTSTVASRVLYDMFDFIYSNNVVPIKDNTNAIVATFSEKPMNLALAWVPKPILEINETIGTIGTYTHIIEEQSITTTVKTVTTYDGKSSGVGVGRRCLFTTSKVTEVHNNTTGITDTYITDISSAQEGNRPDEDGICPIVSTEVIESSITENIFVLYLKKQVTETTCRVIELNNISSLTIINRNDIIGIQSLKANDENFVIPLPYFTIKNLSIIDQAKLLQEALYIQSYAAEVYELEWYETETFGMFLEMIVLFVLFYFTMGDIQAAYAASGNIVSALVRQLVLLKTLELAFKYIMEQVSNNFIRFIAAVALTVLAKKSSTLLLSTPMNAFDLAMIPVNSFSTYYTNETQKISVDLNSLMEEYSNKVKELENILENMYSNLSTNDVVDILQSTDITEYRFSVDNYMYLAKGTAYKDYDVLYNQTKNISDYVENSLKLGINI